MELEVQQVNTTLAVSAKVQKVGKGMDGPSKASYGYTGHGSGFIRHYKALTTLTTFGTFADVTMQQESALKRCIHGGFHDVICIYERCIVVSRHLVDPAFI
jgi:hypothetical protein